MGYKRPDRRKYHFIYETRCKVTGKFYRGKHSTDDLDDGYIGSGQWINRGKKKHGKDRYERTILEFCQSSKDAFSREKELISEVINNPLCMNIQSGGEGITSEDALKLWKSEKFRKKFVEARKQLWSTPEYQATMRAIQTSDEHRAKQSELAHKRYSDPNFAEKQAKALSTRLTGSVWMVHQDHGCQRVAQADMALRLSEGWAKGRKINTNR